MSDIKLKAASGGGSISLKGPSSAGSDTDFLDTSGNLKVTGNTGVGVTASEKLHVDKGAPGGGNAVIARFQAESSRRLDVVWHDSGSYMGFDTPSTHDIVFKRGGNERARVNDNGLAFPSGKGIDFSATADAGGMTSELLDDYEEGTYTPEIWASGSSSGLSITYTGQVGNYTKVGNVVQFSAEINYSAKSGAESNSTAYITVSLPFQTKSNSWGNTSMQFNTAIEFDEGSNNVHHNGGNTYTYFWSGLDAGRQDYYPRTSNLHSSGGIYIAGTYLVA